jgi:hypothetical protein
VYVTRTCVEKEFPYRLPVACLGAGERMMSFEGRSIRELVTLVVSISSMAVTLLCLCYTTNTRDVLYVSYSSSVEKVAYR